MANRIQTTGWLSFFLFFLVLATTALLLGLFTPSWQVVFLEDGRTQHHHGLWLDCKRDFSYDYGRPREYYETLHRRFDLAGPFDQFWLPALNCVFKFDYWLDDEDWYEHNYDENQLWGDAYQHLFLGWKIAALAAHLLSALCALFAIISLICAFCHRLCTCIAAVLVVIALLSGIAGNAIFYMFASDQNTNIIKEEDGIYQQHFGWSFWVSLIGNALMLLCAMFGCVATKVVLGKGRKKFIKIQLDDQDDDSAQLLNQFSGVTASTGTSLSSQQQPRPFRRSKSTIYKIDSKELRRWEKEAMRSIRQKQKAQMSHFKRTNSMPMVKSGSQPHSSISDLSHAITEPPHQFIPRRAQQVNFANSANQHQQQQQQKAKDVIYEYVDQHSFAVGTPSESTLGAIGRGQQPMESSRQASTINNFYDPVPLANTPTTTVGTHQPSSHLARQKGLLIQPIPMADTEYLQPKSLSSDNSSISTIGRKSPLIVPLTGTKAGLTSSIQTTPKNGGDRFGLATGSSTFGVASEGECAPQVPLATFPIGRPSTMRRVAEMESKEIVDMTTTTTTRDSQLKQQHELAAFERRRPPLRTRSSHRLCPMATILSEVPPIVDDHPIRINTFQRQQELLGGSSRFSKSVTDLVPLDAAAIGNNASASSAARAFDRRLTESSERSTATASTLTAGSDRTPTFLGNGQLPSIRDRLENILSSPHRRAPSEMDRSIGSSRTATFLGNLSSPPAYHPNESAVSEESEGNLTVIQRDTLPKMEFGRAWTDV